MRDQISKPNTERFLKPFLNQENSFPYEMGITIIFTVPCLRTPRNKA